MSITLIRDVFQNLTTYDSWSLQLLQIKNSKSNGTTYFSREISLSPQMLLQNLLEKFQKAIALMKMELITNMNLFLIMMVLPTRKLFIN